MAHHDVRLPDSILYGYRPMVERRTDVVTLASGFEERNARWADARRRFEIGYGVRGHDALAVLLDFFEDRRGRLHTFRFKDWADFKSCAPSGTPAATDQPTVPAAGEGTRQTFQLAKIYGSVDPVTRLVTLPVGATVRLALDGVEQSTGWSVSLTTGVVTFTTAPGDGVSVTAGFEFDVRVRFERERDLARDHRRRRRRRAGRDAGGGAAVRTLPAGMAEHLAGGATTLAWCWRLEATDGTVLGFTDHDRDLEVDGLTYRAATGFTASAVSHELGLSVSELTAEGALQDDALTETELLAGKWDHGTVQLRRVNWQDTAQAVLVKAGRLGEVARADLAFEAELRDIAQLAQETRGRVYAARCDATLGDGRCKMDLFDPAFRGTGTVTSATGARFAPRVSPASPKDGSPAGLSPSRPVRQSASSFDVTDFVPAATATVTLQEAPVLEVAEGDTFTITAGCDKRLETCRDRFANVANFRGFPHMPGDDFVVAYASGAAVGDGTSRYGQF